MRLMDRKSCSICSSLFRDEGYEGGIYSLGDLSLQVKFLKSVNQINFNYFLTVLEEF